ncbi:ABC transporter ATP-binding protein [Bdellovibrio sp. HCB-110]|uniref:ABC transporter ATP-binding protein n=1 Tax=Bdellovibrio sp. HCB-110 TaxID=3391182 RepID=UPI0039B3ABE9
MILNPLTKNLNLERKISISTDSIDQYANIINTQGVIRKDDKKISFVALGNNCSLSVNTLDIKNNFLLDLTVDLSTNSSNNFYVGLTNADESILFRLTKEGVVYCKEALFFEVGNPNALQIEIAVTNNEWQLFLDGRPQLKRTIVNQVNISSIYLQLLSDSADLEAGLIKLDLSAIKSGQSELLSQLDDWNQRELTHLIQKQDFMGLIGFLKVQSTPKEALRPFKSKIENMISKHMQFFPNDAWLVHELSIYFDVEFQEQILKNLNIVIPTPIVEVNDLSIKFNKNAHKQFSLLNLFRNRSKDEYVALRDVNFKAYPGDIIGILGANGAGKSTLLKAIAGLLDISRGEIIIRGHHILLSPGLGMRPELSGRENIYLACCYMGLTPTQTDQLYAEILDFSELGEKIHMPYKYYSDGMKSRLVFSIATSIAPEILMLDEILGAGDIKFQQKAANRMDELLKKAKLVLLVTHSIQIVEKKCTKALLISKGNQLYFGSPKEAVAKYLNELHMAPPPTITTDYDEKVGFLGELIDE